MYNIKCFKNFIILLIILILLCGCHHKQSDISSHNKASDEIEIIDSMPRENKSLLKTNQDTIEKGEQLQEFGIMLNVDMQHDLNTIPTRLEVAAYLVDLTHFENEEDLTGFPYIDIPNGYEKIIGYLYQNEIIYGVNERYFGSNTICDSVTFLNFMLRLLQYEIPKNGNIFSIATSAELISEEYSKYLTNEVFTKGDVVSIVYNTLFLSMQSEKGKFLAESIGAEEEYKGFSNIDYNIYGSEATPKTSVNFDKYTIKSGNVYDTNNKKVMNITKASNQINKITDDGYMYFYGGQEFIGFQSLYFDKDVIKDDEDYGMEFTLKVGSIGNEGSKQRTIISVVPRTADSNFEKYYAINYYTETTKVYGVTGNLFMCKWSIVNTNAPSAHEPLVTEYLLLEEGVDYKCRVSIENDNDGNVVIEFFIDGPNVPKNIGKPFMRYIDDSDYKIMESTYGPTFIHKGRKKEEIWGYPSQIYLDNIDIYDLDDFNQRTESFLDYSGYVYSENDIYYPKVANSSETEGLKKTYKYSVRQGILPEKALTKSNINKEVSKIDFIKTLIYFKNYHFKERAIEDKEILEKAVNLGILDNINYDANGYISRYEAAKIVYNTANGFKAEKGYGKLIKDEVLNEYRIYVDFAIQNSFLRLDENMMFNGNEILTTEELCWAVCTMTNEKFKKNNSILRMSDVFGDHAIFQREKPIPIWGYGMDNDVVTVKFNHNVKTTTVKDGKWYLELDPQEAGGPYTLEVSDSAKSLIFKNIYVGEVLILAGQSNMEWELGNSNDNASTINRFLQTNDLFFYERDKTLGYNKIETTGKWVSTYQSIDYLNSISAVGGFTAEALYKLNAKELKGVKIGLVPIAYGGSSIEVLRSNTIESLMQYDNSPIYGSYFNGYMANQFPYGARAILYYQGENSFQLEYSYEEYLRNLIKEYRQEIGDEELPMFMVQLCGYGANYENDIDSWPKIREAQMRVTNTTDNTYLATAIDLIPEDALNIHPRNKKPIGERLGYLISDVCFGKNYNKRSPEMIAYEKVENQYVITFDQDNLTLKKELGNSFEILDGLTGKWVIANAHFDDNGRLHIYNKYVSVADGVRYAWHNYPDTAIFNEYGMPSLPFNTVVSVDYIPDFKAFHSSENTLNMPNHRLNQGDYIINVSKGFMLSEVKDENANILTLLNPIKGQTIGDIIIKLTKINTSVALSYTDENIIKIENHGLKKGDYIINESRGNALRKVEQVIDENTIKIMKVGDQESGDIITLLAESGVFFAE